MSTGSVSWRGPRSSTSRFSARARRPPTPSRQMANMAKSTFEPCAATAAFMLYAERNVILVLHHDTLAIERRFDLHREDIVWIIVDNASERGSGRIAVSYDAGNTAIVWDILSGGEVARFSAYEYMRVACFMRNGNIAFGNDQGNIILFEPSTSEHISARTIFDPITALAPSSDCHTFAIGYFNGSILIATLQPSFTILHTLTTSRAPVPIAGLGWHGSSSKQKTDMLASQTAEGDLRVWSVPKTAGQEPPTIIRVLQRPESRRLGPCWFSWSKNGRILQHAEGETRSWDVRTKKVSWDPIPTIDGVIGLANHGPSATVFTLSRGHCVQQYDVTPNQDAMQVASVQHIPSNTPPTPPNMLDERKGTYVDSQLDDRHIIETDDSSVDEPIRKPRADIDSLDALESELRDKVMPLSPTSSRASSLSSKSSRSRRGARRYLYDKPDSSRASATSDLEGTEFSIPTPLPRLDRDAMSIRSASSFRSTHSRVRQASNLRSDVKVNNNPASVMVELFPHIKEQVLRVPCKTSHPGNVARTPEFLLREMLHTIFGWDDTVQMLINHEMDQHPVVSLTFVMLAKWMDYDDTKARAELLASGGLMVTDMFVVTLGAISPDMKRIVGEKFVGDCLAVGNIHSAVAILVAIGETNDAIEVYVARKCFMEAVLLVCLFYPTDWTRIAELLRKWGEESAIQGHSELAVRLLACSFFEVNGDGWFSPKNQDTAFRTQKDRFTQPASTASPPISPPSNTPSSSRLKNASLRLITSFDNVGSTIPTALDDRTPMQNLGGGVTPIAQSAMPYSATDRGGQSWQRTGHDPVSARANTPGGARKRLPSIIDIENAKQQAAVMATPITAAREVVPKFPSKSASHSRRTSSIGSIAPDTAVRDGPGPLPSPAPNVFARLREQSQPRKERKPDGLVVQIDEKQYSEPMVTSGSATQQSLQYGRVGGYDPLAAGPGVDTAKIRAIDEYIDSVEIAREAAREDRARSKHRGDSRARPGSRGGHDSGYIRDPSPEPGMTYFKSGKRSPSSPIPMSPEEIAEASKANRNDTSTVENEDVRSVKSPVESHRSMRSGKVGKRRPSLDIRTTTNEVRSVPVEITDRPRDSEDPRGRTHSRDEESRTRSPSTMASLPQTQYEQAEGHNDGQGAQRRARSRAAEDSRERRAASRTRRERSSSRRRPGKELPPDVPIPTMARVEAFSPLSESGASMLPEISDIHPRLRSLSKKQLAAKELEDRRLSLARRPSAPAIPLPGELSSRPFIARSQTEQSPLDNFLSPYSRSATVDPEAMGQYRKTTGISTSSTPIGLPATPRAMRHPRHMTGNEEDAPPVPGLPNMRFDQSGGVSNPASKLGSELPRSANEEDEGLGPLLPATVFGQKQTHVPARSASAPPEKFMGNSTSLSNRRMSVERPPSPGRGQQGWELQTAEDDPDVVIVPEPENPPVLPELQHLAGPPPPPPPPTYGQPAVPTNGKGSGLISITIDDNAPSPSAGAAQTSQEELNEPLITLPSSTYANMIDRPATVGPTMQRKPGPSSSAATGETLGSQSFGSRFRGIGDRVRSSSRSRTSSALPDSSYNGVAPYESVLPLTSQDVAHRAKSPYEKAMAAQQMQMQMQMQGSDGFASQQIPVPPMHVSLDARLSETVVPPSSLPTRSASAMGLRNPREIRANMPPDLWQQNARHGEGGFL